MKKKREMKKKVALLICALLIAVATMTSCSKQPSDSATPSATPEAAAQADPEVTAPSEESSQPVADQSEVDDIVAQAKERTDKRISLNSEWDGPTTGPKAAPNKRIVAITDDSQNPVNAAWAESVKQACEFIGWDITIMDGKGTVQAQMAAFTQAISMKVDGIVAMTDAEALKSVHEEATAANIPIVGIHATNTPGADPSLMLTDNLTSRATDVGKAFADYIIADSNGQGRAIILTDNLYAIAQEKSLAMQEQLETCATVELLEFCNSPIADVSKNMPQLTASWIAKYGTPFYVMCVADYYFDFATPTLRSGGIDPADVQLLGADGTEAAIQRVSTGDYQTITIPEHTTLFGYMAVDSLNRVFNGEEPVNYVPDIHIITKDNYQAGNGIDSELLKEVYGNIWGVN